METEDQFKSLSKAVADNDIDEVKKIIFTTSIDCTQNNYSVYKIALEEERDKIFELLMLDVHVKPATGHLKLVRLAIENDRPYPLKLLLDDVRFPPKKFDAPTFFTHAIDSGSIEVIQMFLQDSRFDPAYNNMVLLKVAIEDNNIQIVELLLEDIRVDPTVDSQVICLAVTNNSVNSLRLLLDDGRANPGVDDSRALKIAATLGNLPIVKMLVEDGRVKTSADGYFSIMIAMSNGHADVVTYLLQEKLDVKYILKIIEMLLFKVLDDMVPVVFANEQFKSMVTVDYALEFAVDAQASNAVITFLRDLKSQLPPVVDNFGPAFVSSQTCNPFATSPERRALFTFLEMFDYGQSTGVLSVTLNGQRYKYRVSRGLAEGGYGQVSEFQMVNPDDSPYSGPPINVDINGTPFEMPQILALKNFKDRIDALIETKIIKLFKKYNYPCLQLRVAAAPVYDAMYPSLYPLVVMEKMEGSLKGRYFDSPELLKIIAGICRGLKCFRSLNLMYSDLKADNLLYRCENGHYHVYFGDYGSASADKGHSVFSMVPFMAWPDEYYTQYPPNFRAGVFDCKDWHMVFLLFMTAVLMWDKHHNVFNSQEFWFSRFQSYANHSSLCMPQEARLKDEALIKKYAIYISDHPSGAPEDRRFLHIMRLCFNAKTNGATLDTVLDEIAIVDTLY